MRFSTVLTRTEAFSYKDLDAITAYIMTGIHYPPNLQYNPNGELTEAQLRGKDIFERTHDSKDLKYRLSTVVLPVIRLPIIQIRKWQMSVHLQHRTIQFCLILLILIIFIYSPPYLHDGRAATLEEIWTMYGKTEKHGLVNDMTKNQLNDLVDYLKSLRAPEYEQQTRFNNQASFAHKK